jgi:glutamate receptor, ionotropic, invertebrate
MKMRHGESYLNSKLLINIKTFLRLPMVEFILTHYNKGNTVTVRQLDITSNENYRPQLRRVKQSGDTNIVLCSSIDSLPEILKQAQQVGLMTDEHQFIVTSLDMHTIDLEPFQYSGTNITGFRLVSPDDRFVKVVTEYFHELHLKANARKSKGKDRETDREPDEVDFSAGEEFNYENGVRMENEFPEGLTAEGLRLSTALTYDAVMLFSQVMTHYLETHSNSNNSRNPLFTTNEEINCDDIDSKSFSNGVSIFNGMKTTTFRGLSGDVQFDQHGNRENFQLEVLELTSEGLIKIGTWNASKGIQTTRGKTIDSSPTDGDVLRNKTLIVLTVIVS